MSFVVLNCQVVEWVDIFAIPVFKNPGIYTLWSLCEEIIKIRSSCFRDIQKSAKSPNVDWSGTYTGSEKTGWFSRSQERKYVKIS